MIIAGRRAALGGVAKGSPEIATATADVTDPQHIARFSSEIATAMTGTYHAVKFEKYAHRYLAEVQYRFNRRFDLRSILHRLVRVAATAQPRTRCFIREAEVGC